MTQSCLTDVEKKWIWFHGQWRVFALHFQWKRKKCPFVLLKAFYFIGLEGLADTLSCRRPEHLDCTCKQFLPPCVFHSFAKITSLGLRVLPLYKSAETVFDDSVFSFWLFVFSMTATFATLLTSRGAFSSHASLGPMKELTLIFIVRWSVPPFRVSALTFSVNLTNLATCSGTLVCWCLSLLPYFLAKGGRHCVYPIPQYHTQGSHAPWKSLKIAVGAGKSLNSNAK